MAVRRGYGRATERPPQGRGARPPRRPAFPLVLSSCGALRWRAAAPCMAKLPPSVRGGLRRRPRPPPLRGRGRRGRGGDGAEGCGGWGRKRRRGERGRCREGRGAVGRRRRFRRGSPTASPLCLAGGAAAAAAMHDAFEHVPILEKLPLQIDCLAAWGEPGRGPRRCRPEPLLSPIPGGRGAPSAVLHPCGGLGPRPAVPWGGRLAVPPRRPGRAGSVSPCFGSLCCIRCLRQRGGCRGRAPLAGGLAVARSPACPAAAAQLRRRLP